MNRSARLRRIRSYIEGGEKSMGVVYPLIAGLIFLGVVIVGYGVWNVLTWTSNPFQIWANSKIEDCESRWDSEDED